MMDRGPFKRFKVPLRLAALAAALSVPGACGTAPVQASADTTAPVATAPAALSATETADGSILLVTLKTAPAGKAIAQFEEHEVQFYPAPKLGPGALQAVLGIPFNHKPGAARISVRIGEGAAATTTDLPFTIVDGKYPSEQLHVDKRHVNPRKKDMIRIKREMAEVGSIYRMVTLEKYWDGPFAMPVDSAVTSVFGTKRVFNGAMQSFHQGLDLKAKVGTPIHAAAPGVVVMAKDLFFTGNTVLLDHGYGVFTLYAHMSKLRVKKGQKVKAGEKLGLAGKTGRASGPHLHWGAIVNKAKVNPLELTKVMQ